MPWIRGCCCYESLKDASRASAYYTFATGVAHACIALWLIVTLHLLENKLEWNEEWNFLPPGILPLMYIQLAFSLALLALAFLLQIEQQRASTKKQKELDGQGLIRLWVGSICGFRTFEIFMGMYILIWLGSHRISDVLFIAPYFNFVIFYWVLNTVIMVVAIVCVVSFLQEQRTELFGCEKRKMRYQRLINVRVNALIRGQRSGYTTPRGAYYGSRPTLAASQMSLGAPVGYSSHAPSYQPSSRPSTSSYPEKEYVHRQQHPGYSAPQQPQGYAQPPPQGYTAPPPQHSGYPQQQQQQQQQRTVYKQHSGYDQEEEPYRPPRKY